MEIDLEKEREPNIIIISKPRVISTKHNNKSYLTLKEGEYSLKINIYNSFDSKLNKEKIIKTISDIRKQINNNRNQKNNKMKNVLKNSELKFLDNKKMIMIKEKKKSENISINKDKQKINNGEETEINNDNRKQFTSLVISDGNKLSENHIKKENIKEIEELLVTSINKKSIITQSNKKERQKSIQQR